MEERITVAGQTFIIPASKVSALLAWLQVNAVQNIAKQVVREVTGDGNGRQLLTEQS